MLKPDYNMNSKLHLTTIIASAFTVSLIIIATTIATPTIITTTKTASPFSFIQDAFADHGQEIVLSLKNSSFAPISIGEGNQVKVVVNYAVQDPMITNDLVKGVMKVYSQNGTLIKTSSSPTPFPASSSGTVRLATTLTNLTAESVTASIVFTNPIKTEELSNELPVKLDLVNRPQTTTTATTTTEEEQQKQQQQQMQPKKVTTFGEEEEEQQLVPIEPLPQTTTTTTASIPTTSTTSSITEICNDGLDNDVDTRTDLSDEECNSNPLSPSLSQIPASGPTPPPTQPLEQQQITTPTPEICNDGLDNDIDGKIDTQDEDCIVDTLLSPPPTSLQGQSMIEEQDEGDDDEEQRSDGGGDDDDRDSQNVKGGEDKGGDNEEQSNDDDDEDENDD